MIKTILTIIGIIFIVIIGIILFVIWLFYGLSKDSRNEEKMIENEDDLRQLIPELEGVQVIRVDDGTYNSPCGYVRKFKFEDSTRSPEKLMNRLKKNHPERCFGAGEVCVKYLRDGFHRYTMRYGIMFRDLYCGNIYFTDNVFYFIYAKVPGEDLINSSIRNLGIELPSYEIIAADSWDIWGREWHNNYYVRFSEIMSFEFLNNIFSNSLNNKSVKIEKEKLKIKYEENGIGPYTIEVTFIPDESGQISYANILRGCMW